MDELRRILVPLDGSALSERALPLAITLAKKFHSLVILLRVIDLPLPLPGTKYPEDQWMREAQQLEYREVQLYLDERQADLAREGLRTCTVVRDTSPAEDILAVAATEQVDLIVISSHGKGGQSLWTSGSVANKVIQHSQCPVLVVRPSSESEE